MKKIVVLICGLVAGGMVFMFCIQVLLGKDELFPVQEKLKNISIKIMEQGIESENARRMEELLKTPAPQIRSKGQVCVIGENVKFQALIQVKENEEDWQEVSETTIDVELLDILDESGRSVGREAVVDEASEELTSPVKYFPQAGELCFYQSGKYILKIKAVGELGRYCIVQIAVPVEVT